MQPSRKQGYLHVPDSWEHVRTERIGPFVTRILHRRPDGFQDVRTSRQHRKRFGPESAAKGRPTLLLWRPAALNWWIGLLFMLGALHFITGSVLLLARSTETCLIYLIFFSGSIFFSAAGYIQYYEAINTPDRIAEDGSYLELKTRRFLAWQPGRLDFWATFPQFIGTLAFNINTLSSFAVDQWPGSDLLGRGSGFIGSALFLVSGTAALLEVSKRIWSWRVKDLAWWIVTINLSGCVAFMISALLTVARPHLTTWAVVFTLVGAVCFFVGAYLIWPEMSAEEQK